MSRQNRINEVKAYEQLINLWERKIRNDIYSMLQLSIHDHNQSIGLERLLKSLTYDKTGKEKILKTFAVDFLNFFTLIKSFLYAREPSDRGKIVEDLFFNVSGLTERNLRYPKAKSLKEFRSMVQKFSDLGMRIYCHEVFEESCFRPEYDVFVGIIEHFEEFLESLVRYEKSQVMKSKGPRPIFDRDLKSIYIQFVELLKNESTFYLEFADKKVEKPNSSRCYKATPDLMVLKVLEIVNPSITQKQLRLALTPIKKKLASI